MNSAWEPQKKKKNVRVHVLQKKKKGNAKMHSFTQTVLRCGLDWASAFTSLRSLAFSFFFPVHEQ